MPASATTRTVWAIGIAALVAMAVILSLPIIASTQIVRNSVAQQVSAWSGYRVRLDDAPEIRVWPSFRATLNEVVLSDWRDDEAAPVIEAEQVEIDLSALAALRGEVVFTKIRLIRPIIHVHAAAGVEALQQLPKWGKLPRSLESAREIIAANPAEPDVSLLPNEPFGVIEIVDGRVTADAPDSAAPIISDLNGTLDWPALNSQAALAASAVWRGENVSLNASMERPLMLLAGGKGNLTASLTTEPVSASFNGMLDLSASTYIDGLLEASAPSLKRLTEWATHDDWPDSMIKAATLKSKVSGDLERLKFIDAEIDLDGNRARGAFDIASVPSLPTYTGTLAFDSLDLRTLLATLAPNPTNLDEPVASPSSGAVNFDLRLSAATATAGAVSMTDVAATAQVKDGLVSLDISEAMAFGGMVQIGVRLDRLESQHQAELRVTAEDINGEEMASALQLAPLLPLPRARGSFSIFLKGQGEELGRMLQTADGTISASFGKGTIPGINLEAFRERNGSGSFFPLSDISSGELPIESAELKTTLSGGIAWIDKAEARLGAEVITLGGLIPVAGRGIALSGSIKPAGQDQAGPGPHETFFVGGSWNDPYIAPFRVE